MDKKEFTKHIKKKDIAMMVILSIAIILYGIAACSYVDEVRLLNEYNQRCIEETGESTYSIMSALITSLCMRAEGSLQLCIKDAEDDLSDDDIASTLNLLDSLQRDSYIEEKFDSFFQDNYFTYIRNSNNDIFICDKEYIIANYSMDSNSSIYCYTPWDEVGSYSNTPNITGDALADLLDDSNRDPVTYLNDGSGIEYTVEEVKQMYIADGIDAFKNIDILVPVYITNDLRGHYSRDYYNGETEYRCIIVQEFNIYDQFIKIQPSIEKNKKCSGFNEEELANITSMMYVSGSCLLIGMVIFIIIIIYIYNNWSEEFDRKKK
jgi:hypothetical protein